MKESLINHFTWELEQTGSQILLSKNPDLNEIKELQLRVKNTTGFTLTLDVNFIASDKQKLVVSFDILPNTDVSVPISLEHLNSQKLFPKRTLGRLRMMVNGSPMNKSEVTHIYLSSRPCHIRREIQIVHAMLASETTEGMIYQSECLIDSFGQWAKKDWSGKISDEISLKEKLLEKREEANKSKERHFTKGFFKVKKIRNKWYLLDPNNEPFFSIGLDCITPSVDCLVEPVRPYLPKNDQKGTNINYPIRNLMRVFGEKWYQDWEMLVAQYLTNWGINTIGNWSLLNFIESSKLPYVIPLDSVGEHAFPETKEKIFRDFPDVFSPEYEENAKRYAKSILPFKDDSLLIGYFMRNEPEWAFEYEVNLAEEVLKKETYTHTKKKMIQFLEERYMNAEKFNQYWGLRVDSIREGVLNTSNSTKLNEVAKQDLKDFSKEMVRKYISVPAKAIKELDPNHLNLGMRYAYVANETIIAGFENFDVFSINCYQEDPTDKIQQVANLTDLPVIIGEFHFGGLDKGLTATGIKGCLTQKERSKAYNFYLERAAAHSHFIGAHYFALYDQPCLGRSDGENYQFGFLDVCSLPHQEFIDGISIDGKKLLEIHKTGTSNAELPVLIPPIYC